MKGLKLRSPEGLAADVFRRAGAFAIINSFSEVYTSLEKGIVDAADASVYINNHASALHKIAKYPLYPGIHSMANLRPLSINAFGINVSFRASSDGIFDLLNGGKQAS